MNGRTVRWLLLAGWLLASTAVHAAPIQPFTAVYDLNRGGIPFGRVTIELNLSGDGGYRYQARTVPVGLIAVFRDDEIIERSEGRIEQAQIIPDRYLYHHKREKKPRRIALRFDWEQQLVINNTGDSNWSMPIPPHTQDKFSQQLALMHALSGSGETQRFEVADGGKLKTYRFIPRGEEPVETAAGRFTALRLERRKNERESRASLWVAPELNYLPVRIERHDKDEPYAMLLKSIRWD